MSPDLHLRILRAMAQGRAQQLRSDGPRPGEAQAAADGRHTRLEDLAERARDQLAGARARRERDER